jgi:hypothetical protein
MYMPRYIDIDWPQSITKLQREKQNKKNVSLLKFVKFRENRSSRFQVIAFDGNPTWSTAILDLQISGIERHQHNKNIFRIFTSNFLKISEADCELRYFIELQYGDRPPSRIFNNANFAVTPKTKVIFCLCV